MKVLVIGGASYDQIIHISQQALDKATYFATRTYEGVGSTGIGKAIPLFQLGYDTSFHYTVGEDQFGEKIKQELSTFGFKQMIDVSEHTETHTNIMYESGERTSIYTNTLGHVPSLSTDQIRFEMENCDYIFLNIIGYTKELIPLIKESHKKVWVDLHDYDGVNPYHQDFIDVADVLFLSGDSLKEPSTWIERMRKEKEFLVLTYGKSGATYYDSQFSYHINADKSDHVLDTNGAGDHFMVGFFYGYTKGYDTLDSMRIASFTAKRCVESEKIYSNLLNEEEILRHMERKL